MVTVLILGVSIGFAIGYFVSRKKSPFTQQEASEFGKEGRAAVQARTEKRKARIMARAHELGVLTNDDVEDLFCISDTTAGRYLRILTNEGKLTRFGKGRGTYYKP